MQHIKKIALVICATAAMPSVVQAAIYKCKANGKIEYRDTPCHYQRGEADKVKVTPPQQSGSGYNITGTWCQYAQAISKDSARSVSDPKEWTFSDSGAVLFRAPLEDTQVSANYILSSDYIQVNSAQIGSWFIEDFQSDSFLLTNSVQGVRYLKKGYCTVN